MLLLASATMRPSSRIGIFLVVVALLFAVAFLVGSMLRSAPERAGAPTSSDSGEEASHGTGNPDATDGHGGHAGRAPDVDGGFSLDLTASGLRPGTGSISLRIRRGDGRVQTAFEVEQQRRLHLILVRNDLTGFQHLHPVMDERGTWRTPVTIPEQGTYRLYADFVPQGGGQVVLDGSLQVGNEITSVASQRDMRAAMTSFAHGGHVARADGLVVSVDVSRLSTGELAIAVEREDGSPVSDLQPYLGALGHAVVLHEEDLAYVHAHPRDQGDTSGPDLTFELELELEPGELYHAFVQLRHGGVVRTVDFPLAVEPG